VYLLHDLNQKAVAERQGRRAFAGSRDRESKNRKTLAKDKVLSRTPERVPTAKGSCPHLVPRKVI
jgi:hypothetical protein